jgi:hypothetical protein
MAPSYFPIAIAGSIRMPCILNSASASATVEADRGGRQLDLPMAFQAVR